MALRFNPPPGWPPVPEGFTPQPGWQPDPAWPPPPPGWQLWVDDPPPPGAGYGANMPYGGYGSPAQPATTSGFAIAALVFGLIGGVVLSLIFGIVALVRIRTSGQRGRGLAIAGLVLSGVWIVIIGALIAVAVTTGGGGTAMSASAGKVTQRGSVGVFSLAVGDCFNNPAGPQNVSSVTALPCTQPHDAQVYARFNLTGSSPGYPGAAAVTRLAGTGCNARVSVVDKTKVTRGMRIHYLYPEADSWAGGNRTVDCLAVSPTDNLTGSVLKP